MNTGKIKFYNDKRGFGFITDKDSNIEYFFHTSNVSYYPIKTADLVTFELTPSKRMKGKKEAIKIDLNE